MCELGVGLCLRTVVNYDAAKDIDTHVHRCGLDVSGGMCMWVEQVVLVVPRV